MMTTTVLCMQQLVVSSEETVPHAAVSISPVPALKTVSASIFPGGGAAPLGAHGGFHCLDHMVWGYKKPYYTNCYDDRSSVTREWRQYALQNLGGSSSASEQFLFDAVQQHHSSCASDIYFNYYFDAVLFCRDRSMLATGAGTVL